MQRVRGFAVLICLFAFFDGSPQGQTINENLSRNEAKAKDSEANPNGCGAIVTTTVERGKPSDAAGFVIYGFNSLFKKRKIIADYNCSPKVESFVLSASEITLDCSVNPTLDTNNRKIEVSIEARDADNDPLTYVYFVSGGRIVG